MSDVLDKFSTIPWSQRIFLLLFTMAVILGGFYILVFSEMEDQIKRLITDKGPLITENAQIQTLQTRHAETQAELVRVQDERESRQRISVRIPEGDSEIPELWTRLHYTAHQIRPDARGAKLSISQVVTQATVHDPEYSRIPIEMRLTGTYRQLQDYCWALAEMQERLIHVRAVTMRSLADRAGTVSGGPPLLDVTLNIEAYYKP